MRQALLFILFCGVLPVSAQQRYTDSLYNVVHDNRTDNKTKILALSYLARTVRYYDEPGALQLAEEAVQLSRKEAASYKVYAYAGRSLVFLKMQHFNKAHTDMDSCLLYATETTDVKARSWAYYQKGRQLAYEEKTKEALPMQLQALQLIKGKGYWAEEAGIYYALYGVFSTWQDLDNEDKYAALALNAAQKSNDPNRLCEAWQAMATATEYRYKQTKNKTLLDSTVQSLRNAIAVYRQNEGYIQITELIAIPCINMANAYNEYFPASHQVTDSIRHYAMMAFNYGAKGKDTRIQAAAFGLLQEDAKRNGDYGLAETYLQQALLLILSSPDPDKYLLSSAQNGLADIAEIKKDFPKALEHYKAYMKTYKELYDIEQTNAGKELEAKYEAKEKERQIKYLKDSEAFNRKQKYLYIGIALALLAGLLFMFRSYHFRLRYSLQKEKLLEQEKEEARLLAKLKEDEAQLLESEKQKAELYARLLEEQAKLKAEEAARLEAEQKVILSQKENLQKEVLAGSLHVEQKNKMLQDLRSRLEEHPGKEIRPAELNKLLNRQEHLDSDFEAFKTDLKEIHPDFYRKLQEKADHKLTTLDLKYCAYIYLKRSTKEVANLLGVEAKSVRMSKYRIKQKLGLDKEEELDQYIGTVG